VNGDRPRSLRIATEAPRNPSRSHQLAPGIADANARHVTATDDDAEDFEDLTVPEQVSFAVLDVAFDHEPVRACERALRASRRRNRVRRVIAYLRGGEETVAARPAARRGAC
jgi:hypothetical protein